MTTAHDRRVRRSHAALHDLRACAEWAAEEGWYLLLERQVDERFAIDARDLPPAVVDARAVDALTMALADPRALLITSGGPWWGTPITRDRRWAEWPHGRPYGALGVSLYSGGYLGLHIIGDTPTRFVGGDRERDEEVELGLQTGFGWGGRDHPDQSRVPAAGR